MAEAQNTPVEETPDPATPEEKPFKSFANKNEHDEYINGLVQQRLERKDAKLEEDRERIEREASEKALQDNENWKELARQHKETVHKQEEKIIKLNKQIEELNANTERVGNLETRLRGIIKPKLEQVPELFRPFVEGMGVEDQAEWFEKNADKLEPGEVKTEQADAESAFQAQTRRPAGQPPTGAPAAGGPDKQKAEEAKQEQRQLGISRI